jgi:hypothetical protein
MTFKQELSGTFRFLSINLFIQPISRVSYGEQMPVKCGVNGESCKKQRKNLKKVPDFGGKVPK